MNQNHQQAFIYIIQNSNVTIKLNLNLKPPHIIGHTL